ncbi:hypothetical protein [Dolichospermum phage Dfl-JY23]
MDCSIPEKNNEELQAVIYVFSVRKCQEKDIKKIIDTMTYDVGKESVSLGDNGTLNAVVYELDPENGDNQSLYISEWIEKFPCISLEKTIF